jgi:membrane protease YdiL (CAAX protease family)
MKATFIAWFSAIIVSMENSFLPPSNPPEEIKALPPLNNKFLEIGRTGKNQWWRYLLGILIVFIAGYSLLGQIPILFLAFWGMKKGYINQLDPDLQSKLLNPAIMHIDPNLMLLIELFIFVGAMFSLWIVVKFLHSKKFLSIITSAPKIRWKRFAITAFIWMSLCFIGQLISMQMYPDNYSVVFSLKPFLITLLIGILFLPIQTWWEEYFFRGYLFQGIGQLTKTPIVPILVTGTLFGLVHMANPEVAAYGVANMLPAYVMPGLFLAMMAALDEGLESAMGMHFANNLFGTFAVTSSSSAIQANTIWLAKGMNPGADNLTLLFSFLILMTILWKTNKWDFSKLYR